MIEEIRIENLGVLKSASLAPSPNLTVVTGETGTGKTMVLSSIEMLGGQRVDSSRVRIGSDHASAQADILLPHNHSTLIMSKEAGAFTDSVYALDKLEKILPAEAYAKSETANTNTNANTNTPANAGDATILNKSRKNKIEIKNTNITESLYRGYSHEDIVAENYLDDADGSDAKGSFDAEVLLCSRVLLATGRSKAYLGGQSVPNSLLAEIIQPILTIHGQSNQMRLKSPREQIKALDRAGGEQNRLLQEKYKEARKIWLDTLKDLESWKTELSTINQRRLYLETVVSKVQKVNPHRGEDEEIIARIKRLENSQAYKQTFVSVINILRGSDNTIGVSEALGESIKILSGLHNSDEEITKWTNDLTEVEQKITDISAQLSYFIDSNHENLNEDLDSLHARRAALRQLTRELSMDLEEAIDLAEKGMAELAQLQDPDSTTKEKENQVSKAYEKVLSIGTTIREIRRETATKLASKIEEELSQLAMKNARFRVNFLELDSPSSTGIDEVEFSMQPNSAAPFLPISKGASGGEISRIMLAIELAIVEMENSEDSLIPSGNNTKNSHDSNNPNYARNSINENMWFLPTRTFVFDEVDAGIGGSTATTIGMRIAKISRYYQVIVVTHLAQVAAFADKHFVVRSQEQYATLDEVTGQRRVEELARMLSGDHSSDIALRHAAELLKQKSL